MTEVILREDVKSLGKAGEMVRVKPGFARNYLLPNGLAYEATEGNKKRIAQEKTRLESAENARRDSASELAKKIEEVSLSFSARVGEEGKLFGSITTADIAQQLEAQAAKLGGLAVTLTGKAGEEGKLFGSITAQDVADALAAQGHAIDKRRVELDHPIKTLGDHTVSIRLHADVHAEVRVTVVAE